MPVSQRLGNGGTTGWSLARTILGLMATATRCPSGPPEACCLSGPLMLWGFLPLLRGLQTVTSPNRLPTILALMPPMSPMMTL